MPSITVLVLTTTAVVLGIFYQVYLAPVLEVGGAFRSIEPLNTDQCEAVEDHGSTEQSSTYSYCAEFVIHTSGLVYLACVPSPWDRVSWMPAANNFNATAFRARSIPDYVATYNPSSRTVAKLEVLNFAEPRGLSVHGIDVVPDEHDANLLWVYLVNHRPPLDPTADAAQVGADSAIEIFKTRVGASTMEWVKTVEDPLIMVTPNDIMGGANGQEFWFTNDSPVKTGVMRALHLLFRAQSTWVGYCHVDSGCKVAADQLHASNGIIRNTDGTVWVTSSAVGGYITVHEQQADKTLVPTEVIQVGRTLDNLALSDGSVIAAAAPKLLHFIFKSVHNPTIHSPASAYRISMNTGHSSYFGEKYKIEKTSGRWYQ
ncbi:hypothetical protein FRC10_012293 [Ceratobasidium sp. 414]|nr:hypothetical protein FRC10_012293 [Ceratobasidium sp. 414]